ncbi:MAG: DEAD/DEAH box helicase [Candidatus Nomurabacteria bacterium]|jgi:superfamily II DNA/RNA helicase|nr:DEAD/DEAH box helicase [Candidatus Nomurabacteria bacterium]
MAYYNKSRGSRGDKGSGKKRSSSFPYQNKARSGRRDFTASINPSKFISHASKSTQEVSYEITHKFTDFDFVDKLHANIKSRNYQIPSPIQDQAIPSILSGKDVIGLANTGTGKTAAFLLPTINKVYKNRTRTSVLILAPTRELAQQIDEQFRIFARNLDLYSVLIVGGTNIGRQISELRRSPHFIIATPGRAMDLLKRKNLSLESIGTFIVDEADRMLDMGFIRDLETIANQLPATRQTLFFSATMTPKIKQLTEKFLKHPDVISVKTADTSTNVDQDIIKVGTKEEKLDKLFDLLSQDEYEKVLLFGKTKFGVQRLSDTLTKRGFNSVAIHGNKSQSQRQNALKSFKTNRAKVLVATDVAARGLDIPNVSHVINFDQPATYEDYVHRIGRTGRGNATGIALTFVGA